MQVKKDNIRKTIIDVARTEFFANGYKHTSMRVIAKKSSVTLRNIYNYFKNKDEILEVVLTPVLNDIDEMFTKHNKPEKINTNWFEAKDLMQIDDFREHIQFIQKNREELDLLFHKCSGSKYENIKDALINKYTETSHEYLQLMKEKYPQVNQNISDFFIHMVAVWWIHILSEMVSHNLTEQEILKFGKEYMTFGAGGWKLLMNM